MGRFRKHSISKQVRRNAEAISKIFEDQYKYTTYVDRSNKIAQGLVYPCFRSNADPTTITPHNTNYSISPVWCTRLIRPQQWVGCFDAQARNYPNLTGTHLSMPDASPSTSVEFKGVNVSTCIKIGGSHWFNGGHPIHYSIHYFTLNSKHAKETQIRTSVDPPHQDHLELWSRYTPSDSSLRNMEKGLDYEEYLTGQMDPTVISQTDNHFSAHRWYLNPKLYNVKHSHHGTLGCNPLGLTNARWVQMNTEMATLPTSPMTTYTPVAAGLNATTDLRMEKIHMAFIPFKKKLTPDLGVYIMSESSETRKPPPTLWNNTGLTFPPPDPPVPYEPTTVPLFDVARTKGWRDIHFTELSVQDQLYMVVLHHHAYDTGVRNKNNPPGDTEALARWTAGTENNRSPLSVSTSLRMRCREPI